MFVILNVFVLDPLEHDPVKDSVTVRLGSSQSTVPLETVDAVRPVKSPLVSDPVTLQVIALPLDTAWVNVELSVVDAAKEKLAFTVV